MSTPTGGPRDHENRWTLGPRDHENRWTSTGC